MTPASGILNPHPTVDLERLLIALAMQESANGLNNCPRFEPSYMPKGLPFTIQGRVVVGTGRNFTAVAKPRWDKWGLASSASYSRWQILYHTAADMGHLGPPWELWNDETARRWVVARLNQIAAGPAIETVENFADAWNSGSYRDRYEPTEYMREVRAHYDSLAR